MLHVDYLNKQQVQVDYKLLSEFATIILNHILYIAKNNLHVTTGMYEGKSISKLQMDIEFKQIRVLIEKIRLFLNIISRLSSISK
jgi:hypothetical protein